MKYDNIVLNRLVKGFKIGSIIYRCFDEEKINEVERFELVNKKIRHIYEKSSTVLIEGKTKQGTESLSSNYYDSFIIKSHPLDEEYKLMVLTSGYGFVDLDDKSKIKSSEFVANNLEKWFLNLGCDDLDLFKVDSFHSSLSNLIKNTSDVLYKLGSNGVKAIMALIGPEYTYVCNVGDLRCYLDNGNNLFQFNEEDSYLWSCYRDGYFADKEEFRFSRMKDLDVGMLGVNRENFTSTYVTTTDSFERIFLFSRGVVDCLSEGKIYDIKECVSSSGRVVDALVSHSSNGKKEYMNNFEGEHSSEIIPVIHGQKDTTVCCYSKVLKK